MRVRRLMVLVHRQQLAVSRHPLKNQMSIRITCARLVSGFCHADHCHYKLFFVCTDLM